MASNLEFVNYKQFVESLPARTAAKSGDKTVVSNPTDGPGSETNAAQAQKVLAGNVAPAFDPTRTGENPYKAGESVAYEGKTYTFKVNHYGAWDAADVEQKPINSFVKNKINLFDKDAVVVGEYITALGIASTNSDYSRTDYVPVAGLSTVVGSYLFSGAFYDEDKEFISSFTDSSVNSDHIYDVPDAAVYARVCCKNENVGYAQFGYGLSRNNTMLGNFSPLKI
jgi:hypothetical protein